MLKFYGLALLLFLCLTALVSAQSGRNGKYEFLDRFEGSPGKWEPEKPMTSGRFYRAPSVNLSPYYDEFKKDNKVNIYLGFGVEAYTGWRVEELFEMLQELGNYHDLSLGDWHMDEKKKLVSFINLDTGILYEIQIGKKRNAFQSAFADYEIVMYHGHSRDGRGPAFENGTYYYRMGDVFNTIEVDVRNPYFLDEPMALTSTYPPQEVSLDNTTYLYQYRGQKDDNSWLFSDSYTKNIPGLDKDLRQTEFLSGKQIFYFYSCSNYYYWKNPIRNMFPDSNHKMVFGTYKVGGWGTKPHAVFIISTVLEVSNSNSMVSELNATNDCKSCFTSF